MNRLPKVLLQLIQDYGNTRQQYAFKYCGKHYVESVDITRIIRLRRESTSKLTNQDIMKHRHLRVLCIIGKNDLITDEAIKGLPLTTLRIKECSGITDEGIIGLPLKKLEIHDCKSITDKSICTLKDLKELKGNRCEGITRATLKGKKLTTLQFTYIQYKGKPVTIQTIKHMKTLKTLVISQGRSIYGLNTINGPIFKNLTILNLGYNAKITDDDIKNLPLKSLTANGHLSKISNEGIKGKSLTYLNIVGNHFITDEGIAGMPLVTLLTKGNQSKITGKVLRGMPLKVLIAPNVQSISDEDLKEHKELILLDVSHNANFTGKYLRNMTRLKTLIIKGEQSGIISDNLIGINVKTLEMRRNGKINDKAIMEMKNLEILDISGSTCVITDQALQGKNIIYLNLNGNPHITDGGIKNLPLKVLRASGIGCAITDEGIRGRNQLIVRCFNNLKITITGPLIRR